MESFHTASTSEPKTEAHAGKNSNMTKGQLDDQGKEQTCEYGGKMGPPQQSNPGIIQPNGPVTDPLAEARLKLKLCRAGDTLKAPSNVPALDPLVEARLKLACWSYSLADELEGHLNQHQEGFTPQQEPGNESHHVLGHGNQPESEEAKSQPGPPQPDPQPYPELEPWWNFSSAPDLGLNIDPLQESLTPLQEPQNEIQNTFGLENGLEEVAITPPQTLSEPVISAPCRPKQQDPFWQTKSFLDPNSKQEASWIYSTAQELGMNTKKGPLSLTAEPEPAIASQHVSWQASQLPETELEKPEECQSVEDMDISSDTEPDSPRTDWWSNSLVGGSQEQAHSTPESENINQQIFGQGNPVEVVEAKSQQLQEPFWVRKSYLDPNSLQEASWIYSTAQELGMNLEKGQVCIPPENGPGNENPHLSRLTKQLEVVNAKFQQQPRSELAKPEQPQAKQPKTESLKPEHRQAKQPKTEPLKPEHRQAKQPKTEPLKPEERQLKQPEQLQQKQVVSANFQQQTGPKLGKPDQLQPKQPKPELPNLGQPDNQKRLLSWLAKQLEVVNAQLQHKPRPELGKPEQPQPKQSEQCQPKLPEQRQPKLPEQRQPKLPEQRQPKLPDQRQSKLAEQSQPKLPDQRQPKLPEPELAKPDQPQPKQQESVEDIYSDIEPDSPYSPCNDWSYSSDEEPEIRATQFKVGVTPKPESKNVSHHIPGQGDKLKVVEVKSGHKPELPEPERKRNSTPKPDSRLEALQSISVSKKQGRVGYSSRWDQPTESRHTFVQGNKLQEVEAKSHHQPKHLGAVNPEPCHQEQRDLLGKRNSYLESSSRKEACQSHSTSKNIGVILNQGRGGFSSKWDQKNESRHTFVQGNNRQVVEAKPQHLVPVKAEPCQQEQHDPSGKKNSNLVPSSQAGAGPSHTKTNQGQVHCTSKSEPKYGSQHMVGWGNQLEVVEHKSQHRQEPPQQEQHDPFAERNEFIQKRKSNLQPDSRLEARPRARSSSPEDPHEEKKPYLCGECGRVFANRNHLKQHLYDHIAELTDEHPHLCPKCPGRYFLDMKKHESHHRMGLECDVCGEAFHAAIALAEHRMRVHINKVTLSCKVCRKVYESKSDLKRHQKSHSSSKSYKCKLCAERFKSSSSFSSHMKTHSGASKSEHSAKENSKPR